MEAKELKIGNLVDHFGITKINAGMIAECEINPSRYNPIPLTEEWYIKFDFNKISKNILYNENYPIITGVDLKFEKNGVVLKLNGELSGESKIKYVHQLQNLYFALTGKELECQ